MRTVHKTCNLCEAMCGLRIQVEGGEVRRIEADPDDPLSQGAICPKAIALKEIQEDPDRLRRPVRKTSRGFEPISWEDAFEETAERLARIQLRDGNDAVGTYLGNPGAHSFGIVMYLTGLYAALSTRNRYAASSLDQNPKHAACILLFGNFLSIPVPDVDRTDYLLMLGANPLISNGSLMTAPGFKRRLRALRERGGKLVVVDPRRTETAEAGDEHLFIRPGADGLLLAALVHTVIEEKLGTDGLLLARTVGRDALVEALAGFAPETVESRLGIDAPTVRRLAREFAAAPSAVCYGRTGISMHPYATLANWLTDVLNILTGNLDRPGGAMFPAPAADLPGLAKRRGSAGHLGTWRTRVRGAPAFNDEQPAACLAEEILTPGEGQVRGMLTVAGNPCLSAPNGRTLETAFASLEFYAAIDFYINETTRHADIILPPTWSLEHDAYEVLFHGLAVRNTAKYSPVVVEPEPGTKHDNEILNELALRIAEKKQKRVLPRVGLRVVRRAGLVPGTRRALDWMLRLGPHGDGFRPWRKGLRVSDLERQPSGIDFGPLEPRLDEILMTPGGQIDLAPALIRDELARLAGDRGAEARDEPGTSGKLLLIGRRDMRTNNSWIHNAPMAVKGRERCTLKMHPRDAKARGLVAGQQVTIHSRVSRLTAPLEVSDELMEGVVSLPHGWGHRGEGLALRVASQHPGVNVNDLTDSEMIEPVTGNAVLNGVPVEVRA